MNDKDRQRKPGHSAGTGIDHSLPETVADPSEYVLVFWRLGDQIRLLIAPCRDLHGMTLRGRIGQWGEKAGRRFPENRPGSLSSPHINGVKNNSRYLIFYVALPFWESIYRIESPFVNKKLALELMAL